MVLYLEEEIFLENDFLRKQVPLARATKKMGENWWKSVGSESKIVCYKHVQRILIKLTLLLMFATPSRIVYMQYHYYLHSY